MGRDPLRSIQVVVVHDRLVGKNKTHHILRGITEESNRRYHRREQDYGSFTRSLRLPCSISGEKVKANMKNGIMTITLPKAAEHVGWRIAVENKLPRHHLTPVAPAQTGAIRCSKEPEY